MAKRGPASLLEGSESAVVKSLLATARERPVARRHARRAAMLPIPIYEDGVELDISISSQSSSEGRPTSSFFTGNASLKVGPLNTEVLSAIAPNIAASREHVVL